MHIDPIATVQFIRHSAHNFPSNIRYQVAEKFQPVNREGHEFHSCQRVSKIRRASAPEVRSSISCGRAVQGNDSYQGIVSTMPLCQTRRRRLQSLGFAMVASAAKTARIFASERHG